MNKKYINIFFIIMIIIIIIIVSIRIVKKNTTTNINSQSEEIYNQNEGMKVTLIGGSNMEDKGNINSEGYIIRSKNNKLIIVDGGRDTDSQLILDYIMKYGNGVVDAWFITHAHEDHAGALLKLLTDENINIEIENFYYNFLTDEYYKANDKRGYETEHAMLENLNNPKIKNSVSCEKGEIITIDNIDCEIIRIANPEITDSDNGNEASMVFKMIAKDVNKSIIFLGDAFNYTSDELMKNPEKLKADAVQMAHHGQNGVKKEVYEAINPEVCFFNAPKWLYDNNLNNQGYNTGNWKTIEVRSWLEELGTTNYIASDGDQTINFTSKGLEKIEENDSNN